jgi:hypothetical protein
VTATLTTEHPGANLDVSMRRQGAISGRIFRADVGATAGLENFPVTLTGGAQASTLTDADGFFHFDGLPAGAYAVDASQAPAAFFAVGSSNRTVMLNTGRAATASTSGSSCGRMHRPRSTRRTGAGCRLCTAALPARRDE